MFRRRETETVRTLLRLVEAQQRIIAGQNDRIMHLSGQSWTPPPMPEEETRVTLPDEVEPAWTASPEQRPAY